MACLPRPVMIRIWSQPEAIASSTPYWMMGLSTSGSISFGCAFVAGKKRVPSPAAGNTALRTLIVMGALLGCSWLVGLGSAGGRIIVTVCWWSAIGSQEFLWEGSWMTRTGDELLSQTDENLRHPEAPRFFQRGEGPLP